MYNHPMDIDRLADWLAHHPEIESVTVTEVVETLLTPELTPALIQQMTESELWWL